MRFPHPGIRRLYWQEVLASLVVLQSHAVLAHILDPRACSSDLSSSVLSGREGLSTCPLPIDEDSAIDLGTWAPWKRRPYCVEPFLADEPGPQFCVYTFEPFRGDQGISIITTPVLAAGMIDALDDAVVPPKLRDFSSPALTAGQGSPAYVIKDVPGKGKGLVAKRKIRKWELVLVDHPALLAHMDIFDTVGPETRQDILERALHQLPEHQQREILSLARSSGGEPIEDTMKTNIFGVELGLEIPHLGLFPIASRINHECTPSVFWRYSARTLAVEVIAIRDIEEGEEITQSYVPLGLSYEDRREDLQNWNFVCTCPLCAASGAQRARSNERRERLQQIYFELHEGVSGKIDLAADAVDELTGEMESLVAEEKLETQLLVYYGLVARAYMRAGQLAGARRYVDLCEDLWIRYAGGEEDYLAGMRQLRHELSERERKAVDG
ncbi:SET domain-containing protein [Hypoxylon sp. NC1633]|nr:SET domain-containing protein [Hypoxylon sp. NC1633]